MKHLELLQAAFTLPLVGLIWTIQLLHYPMFLRLDREQFCAHCAWHARTITPLVGPLMLGELICSLLLLRHHPGLLSGTGAALTLTIWLSTACWQSPLHGRLARGRDVQVIAQLIRSNWLRTVAWTLRGVITLALLR